MNPTLVQIHADIDARTRATTEARGSWPCHKGCDLCCRKLAKLPEMTSAELDLLASGFAALPPDRRADVLTRLDQFTSVCPFLDTAAGACSVYESRPVACRTYGFYVERDGGLYCSTILNADGMDDVVWGNADSVDRQLAPLGPRVPLTALELRRRTGTT